MSYSHDGTMYTVRFQPKDKPVSESPLHKAVAFDTVRLRIPVQPYVYYPEFYPGTGSFSPPNIYHGLKSGSSPKFPRTGGMEAS